MRKTVAILFILLGVVLSAGGFFLAIPQDPLGSSPKMPFASLVFILGVMLVFLSAVVYELMPDKE